MTEEERKFEDMDYEEQSEVEMQYYNNTDRPLYEINEERETGIAGSLKRDQYLKIRNDIKSIINYVKGE